VFKHAVTNSVIDSKQDFKEGAEKLGRVAGKRGGTQIVASSAIVDLDCNGEKTNIPRVLGRGFINQAVPEDSLATRAG
jgi:hypothetical protein